MTSQSTGRARKWWRRRWVWVALAVVVVGLVVARLVPEVRLQRQYSLLKSEGYPASVEELVALYPPFEAESVIAQLMEVDKSISEDETFHGFPGDESLGEPLTEETLVALRDILKRHEKAVVELLRLSKVPAQAGKVSWLFLEDDPNLASAVRRNAQLLDCAARLA